MNFLQQKELPMYQRQDKHQEERAQPVSQTEAPRLRPERLMLLVGLLWTPTSG